MSSAHGVVEQSFSGSWCTWGKGRGFRPRRLSENRNDALLFPSASIVCERADFRLAEIAEPDSSHWDDTVFSFLFNFRRLKNPPPIVGGEGGRLGCFFTSLLMDLLYFLFSY